MAAANAQWTVREEPERSYSVCIASFLRRHGLIQLNFREHQKSINGKISGYIITKTGRSLSASRSECPAADRVSEANEGGGGVLGARGTRARRGFGGTLMLPYICFIDILFVGLGLAALFVKRRKVLIYSAGKQKRKRKPGRRRRRVCLVIIIIINYPLSPYPKIVILCGNAKNAVFWLPRLNDARE